MPNKVSQKYCTGTQQKECFIIRNEFVFTVHMVISVMKVTLDLVCESVFTRVKSAIRIEHYDKPHDAQLYFLTRALSNFIRCVISCTMDNTELLLAIFR